MFRDKINTLGILGVSFVFAFLLILVESPDTSAYTATLSITGSNSTDIVPKASGNINTSVTTNEINVITNCRAGYNLTVSAPNDRNLYKDGNSSNNTQGQYLSPVDGSSTLNNTSNAWGYSLTANTESGVFSPLPSTPATLRTPSGTASQTDIDDTISVYYGVSVSNDLAPGQYRMANNGAIVYQLTMDESCSGFTVAFNANGGTGAMSNQEIRMGEATKLTANSFTAPALGTSYQNDDGTTIPAVANKLWAFWGWNTEADGTGDWYKDIEQVTNLTNDGETITLYAQWKQATLADLVVGTPSGNQKVINHNAMQDMSAEACYNSDKFTAIGTSYGQATLTDNRDGITRTYTVAKLPDNLCWMTQNLNLGTSTAVTLTSDNTDLPDGTTFTLPASNPSDFATTSSESNYNKATVLNSMTIPDYTVGGTTYTGKITGYYSYASATANTSTYNSTSNNEIFSNSICPKNWDLPTNTQYYKLRTSGSITYYNNTNASYVNRNAGNEPYNFIYGGYRKAAGNTINSTYFNNPSSYGYLWTSNNYSSTSARGIYVNSSGLQNSSLGTSYNKYYGLGIRCVSNMDNASSRITFVNTDTGETQTQTIALIGDTNTIQIQAPTNWTKVGYGLAGWDTNIAGANVVYTNNQTVTFSSDITLYTVWKPVYDIQYDGNGADTGTMTNVKHTNVIENDVFDLFASNYSKTNYGFAGWSFDQNAQPGGASKIYGPNEAIVAPASITPGETKTLYAVWVSSTGNLQDWQGCSSMSTGDVTALKDTRDSNVYTVSKLADDNCWMMENLRLDTAGSSDSTKAQGFGGVFVGLANPETSNFGSLNDNSLYTNDTSSTTLKIITNGDEIDRFPRYNNINTSARDTSLSTIDNRFIANSAHNISLDNAIYSYGNYYTWAAAMANTTLLDTTVLSESASTSICPSGWELPRGGSTTNSHNDFYNLGNELGATSSNETSSRLLRNYPNNFTYSGNFASSSASERGSSSYYWTSSSANSSYANRFNLSSASVSLANTTTMKRNGYSIRCKTAKGLEIKLMFNDGTDRVGGRKYGEAGSTVNLSTTMMRAGYRIFSWNTAADGSGTSYTNSYTFDVSDTTGVTLYAQWAPGYTIQYDGNGADTGTMTNVKHTNVIENDVFDLFASNYSKTNYGFAGWSFDQNAQPGGASKIYGPNEAIVAPAGVSGEIKTLYAIWVQSTGDLQGWQGCSGMNIGDVTALKDTRDDDVYAVGKLADNNCWMMENLRLDTAGSSDSTKAQGFGGVFTGLADPEASFPLANNAKPNSLYTTDTTSTTLNIITGSDLPGRFPRYNNSNTSDRSTSPSAIDDRSITLSAHDINLYDTIYSYGNYYTWPAAIANTSYINNNTISESANTSICPSGWRIPYGNNTGKGNSIGGFYYLDSQLVTSPYGVEASRALRSYPNNFIYNGEIGKSPSERGAGVMLWTSSLINSYSIAKITIHPESVIPGTGSSGGTYQFGFSVRCTYEN